MGNGRFNIILSEKTNIFTQLTEPATKNGIWIQCNNKHKKINILSSVDAANFYEEVYADISDASSGISLVKFGQYFYFFGGNLSEKTQEAYKYDTVSNTITQLTSLPYDFRFGATAISGQYIYLFGLGNGYNYAYKFDTETEQYTKLNSNAPIKIWKSTYVQIDDDVYFFGSSMESTDYLEVYKYSISNDTYTKLSNTPENLFSGCASVIENAVYIFSGTKAYKYNFETDTYTELSNIPNNFVKNCVSYKNLIYLFGGTYAYKYNTATDTYTQIQSPPYEIAENNAVISNDEIYFISHYAKTTLYKYVISREFKENEVYIETGKYINKIELTDKINISVADIWIFLNGELQEYPTYLGSGENWTKIKN